MHPFYRLFYGGNLCVGRKTRVQSQTYQVLPASGGDAFLESNHPLTTALVGIILCAVFHITPFLSLGGRE